MSCLTVEVEADSTGYLEILLPCRDACTFEPGRSIVETIGPGRHALTYVLPSSVAGHAVRLRVEGSAKLRSVAVGRLAR